MTPCGTIRRWTALSAAAVLLAAASAAASAPEAVFEGHYYRSPRGGKLPYRLFRPSDLARGKTYPLVILLHGNGDQGSDLGEGFYPWYAGHGPFSRPQTQAEHPCFVVRPRCLPRQQWSDVEFSLGPQPTRKMTESMRLMLELVARLTKDLPIDAKRVYLTGYSMGAYGTWDAIVRFPKRFAAAVPISGSGDPTALAAVTRLPIYVAHATWDDLVPVEGSRAMVAALRQAGGCPAYTEYRMYGHNASIGRALADPALVKWLFDETPPSRPGAPKAVDVADHAVKLAWAPAADDESGVGCYRVCRDGKPIAATTRPAFTDTGLAESTRYAYAVEAVNTKHLASARSPAAAVTTKADGSPPNVAAILTGGPVTVVRVRFDEGVDKASAEDVNHYAVAGLAVKSAALEADGRTVRLTTAPMSPETHYTLKVSGVRDLAKRPHALRPTSRPFAYEPGYLARWRFDDGRGDTAADSSPRRAAALLRGSPQWITGVCGAVQFDGEDDYAAVPADVLRPPAPGRDPLAPLTVTARVKGTGPVFTSDDVLTRYRLGVRVEVTPQGRLRVWYGFGGEGEAFNYKDSAVALKPEAWNHVAVVIHGEKVKVAGGEVNRAELYVNGTAAGGEFGKGGGRIWGTGAAIRIGLASEMAGWRVSRRLFRGAIDELAVYGRALSAAEVKAAAQRASGR
jgi:poly(3-hydroxybutyrate) depolymerase